MTVEDRTVTISMLMEPRHANLHGGVHGGEIMYMMDVAAGCAAAKYARHNCVTAGVDEMRFFKPLKIGSFVTCTGTVAYTGNTSIELYVTIDAESLVGNNIEKHRAAEAFITYVLVDDKGRPSPVTPFIPETEQEKELYERVRARREKRREK